MERPTHALRWYAHRLYLIIITYCIGATHPRPALVRSPSISHNHYILYWSDPPTPCVCVVQSCDWVERCVCSAVVWGAGRPEEWPPTRDAVQRHVPLRGDVSLWVRRRLPPAPAGHVTAQLCGEDSQRWRPAHLGQEANALWRSLTLIDLYSPNPTTCPVLVTLIDIHSNKIYRNIRWCCPILHVDVEVEDSKIEHIRRPPWPIGAVKQARTAACGPRAMLGWPTEITWLTKWNIIKIVWAIKKSAGGSYVWFNR